MVVIMQLISHYLNFQLLLFNVPSGNGRESPRATSPIYQPHTSSREFQEMISHLVADHSMLGSSLLERARSLVGPTPGTCSCCVCLDNDIIHYSSRIIQYNQSPSSHHTLGAYSLLSIVLTLVYIQVFKHKKSVST